MRRKTHWENKRYTEGYHDHCSDICSHFSIFLYQSTTEIKEDRQRAAAGGIPDQETRREEKRIKEEKRIYQDKRIYWKDSHREVWTIVPGRVFTQRIRWLIDNRIKKFRGGTNVSPLRFAYNVKDEILAKDKRRKFRLFFPP